MLQIKKNKNTKKLENATGIFESTAFKSFDNLFKIRPIGTLSKNSFNGEKRRLLFIASCIFDDILGVENARISALKKANNP